LKSLPSLPSIVSHRPVCLSAHPTWNEKRSSFDRIIWLGYFAIVAAFQSSFDGFLPIWYVIYITKENQYAGFSGPSWLDQLLFFVFSALLVNFSRCKFCSAIFFAMFCKLPTYVNILNICKILQKLFVSTPYFYSLNYWLIMVIVSAISSICRFR